MRARAYAGAMEQVEVALQRPMAKEDQRVFQPDTLSAGTIMGNIGLEPVRQFLFQGDHETPADHLLVSPREDVHLECVEGSQGVDKRSLIGPEPLFPISSNRGAHARTLVAFRIRSASNWALKPGRFEMGSAGGGGGIGTPRNRSPLFAATGGGAPYDWVGADAA